MWNGGIAAAPLSRAAAAIVGRLKSSEQSALLHRVELRTRYRQSILAIEDEGKKLAKFARQPKAAAPRDAYAILEKAAAGSFGVYSGGIFQRRCAE